MADPSYSVLAIERGEVLCLARDVSLGDARAAADRTLWWLIVGPDRSTRDSARCLDGRRLGALQLVAARGRLEPRVGPFPPAEPVASPPPPATSPEPGPGAPGALAAAAAPSARAVERPLRLPGWTAEERLRWWADPRRDDVDRLGLQTLLRVAAMGEDDLDRVRRFVSRVALSEGVSDGA